MYYARYATNFSGFGPHGYVTNDKNLTKFKDQNRADLPFIYLPML